MLLSPRRYADVSAPAPTLANITALFRPDIARTKGFAMVWVVTYRFKSKGLFFFFLNVYIDTFEITHKIQSLQQLF